MMDNDLLLAILSTDKVAANERAAFELTQGGETDRVIDAEHLELANYSDRVTVSYLGNPEGDEAPMSNRPTQTVFAAWLTAGRER